MADLSDVETALAAMVAGIAYPSGTGAASVSGSEIRIMRGFPVASQVDIDRHHGVSWVYVGAVPHAVRPAPLGLTSWRDLAATPPTMTAAASGYTVTLGGTVTVGEVVGFVTAGYAYAYAAAAGDTLATIAAALAAMIYGATSAGSVVTCPAPVVSCGTSGLRQSYREIRAQEQRFSVTILTVTPALRDTIASAIDAAFAATDWLTLSDHQARLSYLGTESSDKAASERLYRRALDYSVTYSTTIDLTAPTMLQPIGLLHAEGANFNMTAVPPVVSVQTDGTGNLLTDAAGNLLGASV